MLFVSTLLVAFVSLAPTAPADPLHREWISADADWVVHVDVEAGLNCELASLLDEAWESADFQEIQEKLGLDPRRDIASVSVYGSAADPERPVILILGDARLEQALDRLASENEVVRSIVDEDGFSLDRWSDGEGDEAVYTYLAQRADSEKRVLVASPDRATAAAGVAVLRGDDTSLTDDGGNFAAGGGPSAGAFVFVAVREGFSRLKDIDPSSRVAQLVESAVVEAGEFQGEAFLRITVGASTETDAHQISTILQGASALLTLAAQSEEEARPLLPLVQGLTVSAEDSLVTVRFRYPSSKLIKLAQEARGGQTWRAEEVLRVDAVEDEYKRAKPAKPSKKDGWY
jgi:hypothetical protein